MSRLELPLFPIMLALSVLAHGAAYLLWTVVAVLPADLVPLIAITALPFFWSASVAMVIVGFVRRELPLLAIMFTLVLTVVQAVLIVLYFFGEPILVAPELLPSQVGVVSIKLSASERKRPDPIDPPMADLPIKPEPTPLPTPKQPPMERPRDRVEPTPKLAADTSVPTLAELPELTADLIPRLTTNVETAKNMAPKIPPVERPRLPAEPTPQLTPEHPVIVPVEAPDLRAELIPPLLVKELPKKEPIKPSIVERPKTNKAEPKLETQTKVAELVTKPSPAAVELEGSVDDLPQKLPINPPPPYPAEAVAARQEGTVTLRVTLSAEGRVTAIAIYTSSGVQALDTSALTTVRRWLFAPARRAGRAVPFEVLVPIEFSIRR